MGAVQDIAQAASKSAGSQEPSRLAALAAAGRHPQNAERDLHRAVQRELPLAIPMLSVSVPVHAKRRRGVVQMKDWPIFAPHDFFLCYGSKTCLGTSFHLRPQPPSPFGTGTAMKTGARNTLPWQAIARVTG